MDAHCHPETLERVDFCRALDALCGHKLVTRASWPVKRWLRLVTTGKFTALDLTVNDEHARFLLEPFIVERTPRGTFAVWRPSDEDMLATDWEVMT